MKKLVCILALAFSAASLASAQGGDCCKENSACCKTEACKKQDKKDCTGPCTQGQKKECTKGEKSACHKEGKKGCKQDGKKSCDKKGGKKACPSKAK